jgi:hypothetical protein
MILIPIFPQNSILVIDSASNHNIQTGIPTTANTKDKMKVLLLERNIQFCNSMLEI